MKRRMVVALLPVLGLSALALVGCGRANDPWAGETASPRVAVTIAPLASFVKGVLGKHGAVRCLCTTTGPHHYSTDTRDARLFQKADAVFAIGLKLDDKFTDALLSLARRKDLQEKTIKLGERLPKKLKREMGDEDEHDHGEAHHHDHEHGTYDPHVWLGIPQAVAMVETIRDELSKIDEEHAADYKKNAADYVRRLKKLQAGAPETLKGKKIISFHESLGYFADTFGLTIAGVIEVGPGDEPSSGHLSRLFSLCRKEKISAIAVEPQYPKTTSASVLQQDLAKKGVKVPLVPVDPMETADPADLGKEGAGWYEARMRENLKALAGALK
jgi:ABC-type Zn uptake system ZnuABC Zn-binding protein ZnuA